MAVCHRWPGSRSKGGWFGLVLGPREAGDSKGRLNSTRGGWEGAVHGEVAELRGGDRRRWALGEGLGWEVVLWVRGLVRELLGSLNFSLDQQRGRGRRGGGLTGEGEDGGASRIALGRGEEESG
jgi:hypothetical protein